jgi:hypothetical protein
LLLLLLLVVVVVVVVNGAAYPKLLWVIALDRYGSSCNFSYNAVCASSSCG